MKSLFKKLWHGLVFTVVLPFWLVVFALFTIWAMLVFFFTFLTAIPGYFRGESILAPDELDVAATTKIAEEKLLEKLPPSSPVVQQQQPVTINLFTAPPQAQTEVAADKAKYIEQDGTIYRQLTQSEQKALQDNIIDEEE